MRYPGTSLLRLAAIVALLAWGSPSEAQAPIRMRLYAAGFVSPVAFVQDPTRRAVQYVVEQGGRVRVVQNGAVLPDAFLDLTSAISSGGERGLLGMAFAPDYAASGRFYVNFTDPRGNTVVARFHRSANPLIADHASRFDLRWGGATGPSFIAQPFANHNGGNLVFGPDGFLYIGLGDGGSGDDPGHRAQSPTELLGKMLRIDVNVPDDNPSGYQVPPSNPFIGAGPAGTLPEIWSFGLRNPFRYSFDDPARGGTGALLIGDVGQNQREEIDYEPPNRGGRNYGWRNREGRHDNVTSLPPAFLPLVDPIHEYDHTVGQTVTGGYVYRGCALGPTYRGRYFFADFAQGRVWSLGLAVDPGTGEASVANIVEHTAALGGNGQLGNISSFGLDADGELYAVSYSRGAILKIEPVTPVHCGDGDFDGDGKADISVFRPSNGNWFILGSSTNATYTWGGGADIPVAGDYDGDGRTDVAVFRPSTGEWFIIRSSTFTSLTYTWGGSGDIPVPGDYDGDGRTDIAVFRPSTGEWFIVQSSTGGGVTYTWGGGADIPVAGDYDGDGRTDVAVFRPSTGEWFIIRSSTFTSLTYTWGGSGDIPVPGDYDGDGLTDIAVFRRSTNMWFIVQSTTAGGAIYTWGGGADIPVPSDYDGDGKTDVAVFRPSTGTWFIVQSKTFTSITATWGGAGDIPILKR